MLNGQTSNAANKYSSVEFVSFPFQGLTVRLEGIRIKVARILIDSVIDRQGLVQEGDIILQVSHDRDQY